MNFEGMNIEDTVNMFSDSFHVYGKIYKENGFIICEDVKRKDLNCMLEKAFINLHNKTVKFSDEEYYNDYSPPTYTFEIKVVLKKNDW